MGNPQARWLVYFMENPYLQMDDNEGYPRFRKPPCLGMGRFSLVPWRMFIPILIKEKGSHNYGTSPSNHE